MPVSVTITADTPEEAKAQALELLGFALLPQATAADFVTGGPQAVPPPAGVFPAFNESVQPKKRRGRPPKSPHPEQAANLADAEATEPVAEEPVAEAAEFDADTAAIDEMGLNPDEAEAAVVDGEPTPATIDDVRAALRELVGRVDLQTGANVLAQFGAAKVTDLKADQFGDFIAAAQAA